MEKILFLASCGYGHLVIRSYNRNKFVLINADEIVGVTSKANASGGNKQQNCLSLRKLGFMGPTMCNLKQSNPTKWDGTSNQ
ncbi:hypothetical protein PanWU01x14_240280 [Parasponia andersonii]|uniref:Uncharacterized protein n=1 Tax=Parasponia andersonii TaxID=3476 RepID=A0A2P5BGY3_PARAD|nr:hypothetical protein PanWU01x14_240280 [Parasponia andersonii]